MLKKEYYCLVAGLPDLFFNEDKSVLDSIVFRQNLESELVPSDYELVKLLYLPFDNKNLLTLCFNQTEAFISKGNFSRTFFEQQLDPENENPGLPEYMLHFLQWKRAAEIKQKTTEVETVLHELYYDDLFKVKNAFLRNWFLFELNLKNILTTFSCIKYNHNLEDHLIKNPGNSNVSALLIQRKLKPQLFEDDVPFCNEIFKIASTHMSWIEKEKALDTLKWDYLDEHSFFYYFTIEKILTYIIRLLMIERWIKMDKKTGNELLIKLIEKFRTDFEFSEEFSLTK